MSVETWTFFGHWENDRIVVTDVLSGEVVDTRCEGQWEQGLWSACGSGATVDEARAEALAEYEVAS